MEYFMNLFKTDEWSVIPPEWPNLFEDDIAKSIDPELCDEEIKQAVFLNWSFEGSKRGWLTSHLLSESMEYMR